MQSIVQLPYNIYHALNKLRLGTRRSLAPIKKCALITKVRLLTRFYGSGLVSRLASSFFVLMLTSPHLALFLLLADYFTAIATTSVPLSGHYSSESSTPASRLAKVITSAIPLMRSTTH